MQSLDGIVTSVAAREQAAQDVAKDVLLSAERTAALMGNIMDRAQTMMGLGVGGSGRGMSGGGMETGGLPLWAAWSQAGMTGLTGTSTFVPGAIPGSSSVYHGVGAPVPSGPPTPMAPTNVAGTPPGAMPDSSAPAPVQPRRGDRRVEGGVPGSAKARASEASGMPSAEWPKSFEEGQGFSLGDLRQGVARSINKRVTEWGTAQEQTLVDDLGRPIVIDGETQTRRVPKGSPLTAAGDVFIDDDGNVGAQLEPGYVPTRAERFSSMARNVAGSMSDGGGLGESVSSALPRVGKALGVAGAAYTAVNAGLNFAEDQRSRNQEFQSMLGGANSEGFRERWNQNLFRLSLRGSMSGADAEAIYKGAVGSYGTQQDRRRSYESAAVDLYRNAGLSGSEAASMLDQAAGVGNDNLAQFADAIISVGRAAREAGENAQEARQFFSRAFASQSEYSTGSVAVRGAEALTTTQTSMGSRYADVDFTQMDNDVHRRMAAQSLGMSYADYSAAMIEGGRDGIILQGEGRSALVARAFSSLDPTGRIQSRASELIRERTTEGTAPEDAFPMVAAQIQREFQIDPLRTQALLQANAGLQLSEADALAFMVQYNNQDGVDFAEQARDQVGNLDKAGEQFSFNLRDRSNAGSNLVGGYQNKEDEAAFKKMVAQNRAKGMSESEAIGKAKADEQKRIEQERSALYARINEDLGEGTTDEDWFRTAAARGDWHARSGKGSKTSQVENAIVRSLSSGVYNEMLGEYYRSFPELGDDVRFEVDTADGKKAVGPVELVDYYADQIQNNPHGIKVIGGKQGGGNLGDVMGVERTGKDNKSTASGKSGAAGPATSVKDAREHASQADSTVEIRMQPWMEQYFRAEVSGAARYYEQRGQTPPSSTTQTPAERTGVGN